MWLLLASLNGRYQLSPWDILTLLFFILPRIFNCFAKKEYAFFFLFLFILKNIEETRVQIAKPIHSFVLIIHLLWQLSRRLCSHSHFKDLLILFLFFSCVFSRPSLHLFMMERRICWIMKTTTVVKTRVRISCIFVSYLDFFDFGVYNGEN